MHSERVRFWPSISRAIFLFTAFAKGINIFAASYFQILFGFNACSDRGGKTHAMPPTAPSPCSGYSSSALVDS